jgi:hypothetical protein
MTAEMAPIPPTTPPAMAPVFELCLPTGVAEFELVEDDEEVEVGPVEEELTVPDGPRSAPGPISGLSKEVRCKCDCDEGRETKERILTTDNIRLVDVPKVVILERALSMKAEKESFSNEP